MSEPMAKRGDPIVGLDVHVILVPSAGGPVPTVMLLPFDGPITTDVSSTVFVDDQPAATVGSGADNQPVHIPPGGSFQKPPGNRGTVSSGSGTVFIDHRAVARGNDPARCCNDPADSDSGHVVASSTVIVD